MSCTLALSGSAPGGVATATCSRGVMVWVGPKQECVATSNDSIRSLRCDPVPGQLVESIQLEGTPASVHITQSLGDLVLLDEVYAPVYHDSQPNGAGCEPICRQATVKQTLPQR